MNDTLVLETAATPKPWANGETPLHEIVNGRLVELPPMSGYAGWIASRLDQRMGSFAEEHALGTVVTETMFVLDPEQDLRRRPDVAFVSVERWSLDQELPLDGDWAVVPDLAVEVVSPSDLLEAVVAKMCEYFRLGVRQVWVVLPGQRQVYVYDAPTRVRILSEADELEAGSLVPGFRLQVATLFRRKNGSA